MSFTTSRLRRGDTHDRECHRTSHRLEVAWKLLAAMGIDRPTIIHSDNMSYDWAIPGGLHSNRHSCDWKCRAEPLSEWVTDEILDAAYALADKMVTERGAHHRAAASREKYEREMI